MRDHATILDDWANRGFCGASCGTVSATGSMAELGNLFGASGSNHLGAVCGILIGVSGEFDGAHGSTEC